MFCFRLILSDLKTLYIQHETFCFKLDPQRNITGHLSEGRHTHKCVNSSSDIIELT